MLERLDPADREPMLDVHVLRLRHHAYRNIDGLEPAVPPPPAEDPPDRHPGVRDIPEVAAADLSAAELRAALHHHGSLLVRGLLPPELCADLRADIDRSFATYDERAFKPVEATAPWYADLDADDGFEPLDPLAGAFLRSGGGVYAPCAPRAFIAYRNALADAGVLDVVAGHLGEIPVVSV